ncbi:hypothetical protein OG948_13490 [Embleya sp. NBC_00888]|uniref:ATP-binding protein n=1 Tax=Embleya sp. NBC_00888 TaxID=2975960 RepID=UPI0038663DF5|nr:hypothetical protein OG948_13490 [Embleya sp. NBC_00888]
MFDPQRAFSQLTPADTPNAVTWACRHVVDVLRQWRVSPEVIEAARFITTELATNAIGSPDEGWSQAGSYSARSPVGTITISLSFAGSTLVVSVCEPIRQAEKERTVDRGSLLAAVMSHRWGYYCPTPTSKVVWAELLLGGPSGSSPAAGATAVASRRAGAAGVVSEPLLLRRVLVGLRQL